VLRRALFLLTLAFATIPAQQGLQIPAPVGYVNDFARVIPADRAATISRIIDDVRAKSGGEIVVVTLPDLGGRPIEEVSLNIGRQWKVGGNGKPGDPARNTGVIILVVPKETSQDGRGHVRIETGNGAEGFITDATTGQIRDEMVPYFQRQDYGGGIAVATIRVAQRFANEFQFQLDSSSRAAMPPPRRARRSGTVPPFVWVVILFVILSLLNGGGRRGGCLPIFFLPLGGYHRHGWRGGGWGGGGFGGGGGWGGGGGGFGGFGGGGGFSGGGSSGSW
jgi:uncharacterized protein